MVKSSIDMDDDVAAWLDEQKAKGMNKKYLISRALRILKKQMEQHEKISGV